MSSAHRLGRSAGLLLVLALAPGRQRGKIATHFFYWYDAPNNNVDASKMPFDPPGLSSQYNGTYYSSLSTPWYQWQLADMKTAGIDYVFPVSWGEKYQTAYFKQSVLSRLVDAIRNTASPLKVGLYDDTQSEAAEWNADNGRGYVNSTTDPNRTLARLRKCSVLLLQPEDQAVFSGDSTRSVGDA